MSGCKLATLADRALVRVGGEDAEKFLQGLVTCDVDHLKPGEGAFGALLTPQGKILFDFFILRVADGFLIDVAKSMRDDFVRRLAFYKLRAAVDIEPAEGTVWASWDGTPDANASLSMIDPRVAAMGMRHYGDEAPAGEPGDYEAHRIGLGVPEGGKDYVFGDSFPHEALMDQFGGVDFTKGCYVGQEVVSRMEHRGTARTRIVMVTAEDELPHLGTDILAAGKPAGTMGSSSGTKGLAKLRLDRVMDALNAGGLVMAGSQVVTVQWQSWVTYGCPEG